jgi:hypothetical protein
LILEIVVDVFVTRYRKWARELKRMNLVMAIPEEEEKTREI